MPGPHIVLAVLFLLVDVVVAFFDSGLALWLFAGAVALVDVYATAMCFLLRPRAKYIFNDSENYVFRRYYAAIALPAAIPDMGRAVNLMRLVGLLLVPLLLWRHAWVGAGAAVVNHIAMGLVCVNCNPLYYLGAHAARGDEYAAQELDVLRTVMERLETFRADTGKPNT